MAISNPAHRVSSCARKYSHYTGSADAVTSMGDPISCSKRACGRSNRAQTNYKPARKASKMSFKYGYREAMHGVEAGRRRRTGCMSMGRMVQPGTSQDMENLKD